MTNKSNSKTLTAVFSLILLFSIGTLAGNGGEKSKTNRDKKPDCTKISDDDIVKAIYEKINGKYANQQNHINVRIKEGIVTLEGWTTTKSVKKDVEKYAKKASCVKKVANNLTVGVGGGCGPGQKKCGGICIDATETCNISSGT